MTGTGEWPIFKVPDSEGPGPYVPPPEWAMAPARSAVHKPAPDLGDIWPDPEPEPEPESDDVVRHLNKEVSRLHAELKKAEVTALAREDIRIDILWLLGTLSLLVAQVEPASRRHDIQKTIQRVADMLKNTAEAEEAEEAEEPLVTRCTPENRVCVPGDDSDIACGHFVSGYVCTRSRGHIGPCIACCGYDSENPTAEEDHNLWEPGAR